MNRPELTNCSSTYYRYTQNLQQPVLRAIRCVSDECLLAQIQTV